MPAAILTAVLKHYLVHCITAQHPVTISTGLITFICWGGIPIQGQMSKKY